MNNSPLVDQNRLRYVALGSSFAAGLGLESRSNNPLDPLRKVGNGYPQQLARLCNLSIVDRSRSGATTRHVLQRGPFGQRPQVDGITPDTQLITLTVGGNDINYVGDLTLLALRARSKLANTVLRLFTKPPLPAERRDFSSLSLALNVILQESRRRSPAAKIAVVTYPQILPPTGTNEAVGISENAASLMRVVAYRLDQVTRVAASDAGAIFIDIAKLSAGHHAGSALPWVNGAFPKQGAPFHPTLIGAAEMAQAVAMAICI